MKHVQHLYEQLSWREVVLEFNKQISKNIAKPEIDTEQIDLGLDLSRSDLVEHIQKSWKNYSRCTRWFGTKIMEKLLSKNYHESRHKNNKARRQNRIRTKKDLNYCRIINLQRYFSRVKRCSIRAYDLSFRSSGCLLSNPKRTRAEMRLFQISFWSKQLPQYRPTKITN